MNYLQSFYKVLNHPLNKKNPIKTVLKVIWWKINQIFFKLPAIVTFTPEMKIICEPESSYGSYVIYAGFPEYAEMKFIYDYLKNEDTFIDVGAHIGSEILLAASKINKGKIYGFEPTNEVFIKLEDNLLINNLKQKVKIYKKIVSDKNGFEKFILKNESETNRIATNFKHKKFKKIVSTTLDSFIRSQKIKFVDFLKIDVEGAEHKVLRGLKNNLQKNKVGVILFELNKHIYEYQSTPTKLLKFIVQNNYSIYKITDGFKLKEINIKKLKLNKTINLVAVLKIPKIKKRIKLWLT